SESFEEPQNTGFDRRLVLKLNVIDIGSLDPEHSLAKADVRVLLSIGRDGITFEGHVETAQTITILPASGASRAVQLRALPSKLSQLSLMKLLDTKVITACMFYELDVPALKDASISGDLGLSQGSAGKPPVVVAHFDVQGKQSIVGALEVDYFRGELDELRT